jgi:hypothetical protein
MTEQATASMIELHFERFKIAGINSLIFRTRATTICCTLRADNGNENFTLLTVSYLNDNMPTTGYNYSLQTNKKSVTGKRNELPDKTALAKLKEVGDLIVFSTQKELPVTGALFESNQHGNGNM